MSIAEHLKIRLEEYDDRVRTFIPGYAELVERTAHAASAVLRVARTPVLVDLGVGTGAVAARCLAESPRATLFGVDVDPAILAVAARRFARRRARVTLVRADLETTPLPRAHAITAVLALHHVRSERAKRRFYRRAFESLRPGGILVTGDCHPSTEERLAAQERLAWLAHMRRTYTRAEVGRFLAAWAEEDTYMTLDAETAMMRAAGFSVDVVWRQDGFAVLAGARG